MADERRLDGNAIGGMMLELFGVEMTTVTEVCRTCGTADLFARTEVYMDAPGTVVRCPSCHAVVMVLVTIGDECHVHLPDFDLEQ